MTLPRKSCSVTIRQLSIQWNVGRSFWWQNALPGVNQLRLGNRRWILATSSAKVEFRLCISVIPKLFFHFMEKTMYHIYRDHNDKQNYKTFGDEPIFGWNANGFLSRQARMARPRSSSCSRLFAQLTQLQPKQNSPFAKHSQYLKKQVQVSRFGKNERYSRHWITNLVEVW